jgi:hypothetical protein
MATTSPCAVPAAAAGWHGLQALETTLVSSMNDVNASTDTDSEDD